MLNIFKKIFTRKFILIILPLLVIAGVTIYFVKPFGWFKAELTAKGMKVEQVKKGDLSTDISVSGIVEAESFTTVSFLTTGRVVWVGFKEGEAVEKGQTIASLDTTQAKEAIAKAEANYHSAQSTVEKVLDDTHLWQYGNNKTTGETQTQKNSREIAEMARDAAYRDLQSARKQLEWSTIIAPFDGIIADMQNLNVGQNITATSIGQATLINGNTFKFVANVDEIDFSNLTVGQTGEVILDAYPQEKLSGQISKIAVAATKTATGGSVIPVEISLPVSPKIKHGLNGEVTFVIVGKTDVLIIPKAAVHKDDGQTYVYLVKNNKLIKTMVTIGESLGSKVEIISGIEAGNEIALGTVKQ